MYKVIIKLEMPDGRVWFEKKIEEDRMSKAIAAAKKFLEELGPY